MLQEADTDDNQGTLDFEEFCAFYKMMSTRRDLYLLMLTYSNHKDYLDTDDLKRFLETEQKVGPSQQQNSSCMPSCLALGMNSLLKGVGTLMLCMRKTDRCLLIFICRLAGLFLESSCSHYLFFFPVGSFVVPLNIISGIAFFFHAFPLNNSISSCLFPVFNTLEQSWCSWLCL